MKTETRDEILAIRPRELYQDLLIPDALEAVLAYRADKQSRVMETVEFDLPERLSQLRDQAFLAALLQDVEKWLRFFYFAMLYRVVAHVQDISGAFDDRMHFRIPNSTRSLLELFLLLYTSYREIYKLKKQSQESNDLQTSIANEIAIRDILLKQAVATRVNWKDPFGPEWESIDPSRKQTNTLTWLNKLPDDSRELVKRWYAVLSDVCHPNYGSVLFVMDHESIDQSTGQLALVSGPGTHAHVELTVDVISAPLGFACIQHVKFLSVLENLLKHYGEGANRFPQ